MTELKGEPHGEGRRFAIVVARFNSFITLELLAGARTVLTEHGVDEGDIHVVHVPGAWELAQAARQLIVQGDYDGVVGLGCVIRGETPHFDYVAGEAAIGLGTLAREADVPVAFGVLTTDTVEQAAARSGPGESNKGREAALSVLEMADLYRRIAEHGP